MSNSISTKSIIVKDNISTKSIIKTNNISTKSIIKGDYDIYGNIIEYDPNDWIGEDYVLDRSLNIESKFNSIESEYGTLDIALANEAVAEKSNIMLSLVDEGYNIHNVYIYYKNSYHEKVDLMPGKYKVNNAILLTNNLELEVSEIEFTIEKNQVFNLVINNKESKHIMATKSNVIIKNEEKEEIKQNKPIYIYILIVIGILVVGFGLYRVIRTILERKSD